MRQKEVPRWGGCSYKEKIRRGALYRGINSLAFMILGAETIFPPSFYSFPYLLVYPFSQEFDAISPQLPWTVCTFDKEIIKFGVHVYRVLPFANISILSLKKNKHTQCVYIFRQLYSRKTRMKDSMPRAFFSSFIVKSSVSSFETSFLYLILGNICSNFVFFLLFSFLRRVTREIIYLFHGQGLMYRWCYFDTFHPQDFLFWRVVANNCRNTTFNPNVNPLVYFSLSNEGKEGATASTKIAISL